MKDLRKHVYELYAGGLCCSQVVMEIVGLSARGEEDPEMIRALGGLGYGTYAQLTCGALTGGACALALYAEDRAQARELINDLTSWFEAEYGTCSCKEILGCGAPSISGCKDIVIATVERCLEILEAKL
ncbi:MAG: C-GCAxxG-C-C family protein [Oscillospiraceae bacterium]